MRSGIHVRPELPRPSRPPHREIDVGEGDGLAGDGVEVGSQAGQLGAAS